MEFILNDNNCETAEERAIRRFGSVDELKKQLIDDIPSVKADILLILYEIIIRTK